jgi:hypothetical protein
MADQCEMIIGYLVPHRCDHPALGNCSKCGRSFCDEHMDQAKGGLTCLACQQGLDQPVALPIAAATFTAAELTAFNQASMWDDDDRTDMFSDLS